MLQNALMEHSAILSTCTKLPPDLKTFVLHARIQDFFQWGGGGGGGGGGPTARKQSGQHFLLFVFFSPQLNLQFTELVQWCLLPRELYCSKDPEGVQHFPGWGGVKMLISIETHITCDFPDGVGTPYPPPPDLHMFCLFLSIGLRQV